MEIIEIKIDETSPLIGQRLDKVVGSIPAVGSRSKAESLISQGLVSLNSKSCKPSVAIKSGDQIQIQIPDPTPTELQPLDLALDILFEDTDIVVVNKPAGLVMHPAAGHAQDTLVNALLGQVEDLSMGFGEERPGIVHRLDKDTSGILVVAKNDKAQEILAEQFKSRTVHRIYFAMCMGVPREGKGRITSYLARHPTDRKKYASVLDINKKIIQQQIPEFSKGKWAATNYQLVKQTGSGISLLKLKLETGRTHQIRVHLSEMGWPIIADPIYGSNHKLSSIKSVNDRKLVTAFPRLALHAAELGFQHPKTNESLLFKVDWPQDLHPLLSQLGFI